MPDKLLDSGYLAPSGLASFRYHSVWDEHRRKALGRMVELYNECQSSHADGDAGWTDQDNRALARQLKTQPYKRLTRSSIAPLFVDVNGEGCFSNDKAKEYFDAHGGVENAHKAKLCLLALPPGRSTAGSAIRPRQNMPSGRRCAPDGGTATLRKILGRGTGCGTASPGNS